MKKRRIFTAEFKACVALEALTGAETTSKIVDRDVCMECGGLAA
jgi:transposase-like protein